jgi:hypothetical protein
MKAKPIILVIITLVIGFVLGMLTSAQLRFHKLKPVRMYFSEERFREGFFNTIQPDEKQRAAIELILNKYAKLNSTLQTDMRRELDSNIKEMRKELDTKLTKEQLERLKAMEERRQDIIRQNRKNRNDSINPHNRPDGPQKHQFRDGRPMPHPDRPSFPPDDSMDINRK